MALTKTQQDIMKAIREVSIALTEAHADGGNSRKGWDGTAMLDALNAMTQQEFDTAYPEFAGLTPTQIANAVTSIDLFRTTITDGHLTNLLAMGGYK